MNAAQATQPVIAPNFGVLVMENLQRRQSELTVQANNLVEQFRSRKIARTSLLMAMELELKSAFDRVQCDDTIPEDVRLFLVEAILKQGAYIDDLKAAN